MDTIPVEQSLLLAAILFVIGLIGVLSRKNVILMLMSVEIMLNASGLAFVVAGSRWVQPDGQVMFIFILSMAAAEVSVGLALILQMFHVQKSIDSRSIAKMNDL
ncbi:MAG: NADH-quinone oxidoreductase subunit NuoK [Bacteroidales bacterium]|jgi:NADH-quinone oxidoreductase subunit K